MPQVGFYDSPEVNAFATGPSKNRSLVAVSTGLLQGMGKQEIQAVLGHELTHVANGDMVTMTLIQGVVNAFVLYLSHIAALVVRNVLSRDDERGPSFLGMLAGQLVFIAAQIVFGLLGSMITAWFSRQREFRADAGGATLAGRGSMISALRRLESFQARVDNQRSPELATLKIAGGPRWLALLVDASAARAADRGARRPGLGLRDQRRQQRGAQRQVRDEHVLVAGVRSPAARAEAVERRHAGSRHEVSVRGAADARRTQLEAELFGQPARARVERLRGRRRLERRPVEAALDRHVDAARGRRVGAKRPGHPLGLGIAPGARVDRERGALGHHVRGAAGASRAWP